MWATPTDATIRSFSGSNVPNPGSAAELRSLLSLDYELEDRLKLDHGKYGDEYLTCLSQLLQFVRCHYILRRLLISDQIMDDTATDTDSATASRCRRNALRFLRQLATKRSILPPSLFLNNLKREGSNGVRHAVGRGAFAVSFVLSVLRGRFSWVSMSGLVQGSHSRYSFLFPRLAYVCHGRDTRRTRKTRPSNFLVADHQLIRALKASLEILFRISCLETT